MLLSKIRYLHAHRSWLWLHLAGVSGWLVSQRFAKGTERQGDERYFLELLITLLDPRELCCLADPGQ